MSQSQTRRKGLAILQDEINDIVRVFKNQTENVTRRLEKVKDMTSKYCGDMVKKSLALAPPSSVPSSVPSSIPPPTVGSRALNTIPEGDETNSLGAPAPAPLAAETDATLVPKLKSKGPIAWTTFRSKVAESRLADGSLLKTGQQATMDKVATLWKLAKDQGSVGDIEKFLVKELHVAPTTAAQKAPELELIARRFVNSAKSKTRKLPAPLSKAPRTKKVPVPEVEETIENWTKRMTNAGTANYEAKTQKALANYAQREKSRALAATRLTPGKNRPGAAIPALIPFENKVINGKKYALNTAQGSLYAKLADGSMGEYVGEYNANTGGIRPLNI